MHHIAQQISASGPSETIKESAKDLSVQTENLIVNNGNVALSDQGAAAGASGSLAGAIREYSSTH